MTGFKLSWRIENENPPRLLIATISEVGRSVQTPGLGDSSLVKPVDLKYKAILTKPEDLPQKFGKGSLVIEVDVDMKEGDEVNYAMMKYKLYREGKKSWDEAEAHCRREGGQLASIHSKDEQAMAAEAADGNNVWIGGRRKGMEEQWHWSDNSPWGFTNWQDGRGDSYDGSLLLQSTGAWYDTLSHGNYYVLCNEISEAMSITNNGFTTLELKESFFPFLKKHFPISLTLKSPTSNASAGRGVRYIS